MDINFKIKKMEELVRGAFVESLKRNNRQIKEDRATAIAEDAELLFKRTVEDLETEIKRTKRERDAMLDLSGTSTTNIIAVSDFDAHNFVVKDLELGLKIRNLEIKLEIAKNRYNELFNSEITK